jgi:hypothetical protein
LFDLCDNDKKYRIEFENGCGSSNIHKVTSRESRRPVSPGDPHVADKLLGTLSIDNLFVKASSDKTPFNNIKVEVGINSIHRLYHFYRPSHQTRNSEPFPRLLCPLFNQDKQLHQIRINDGSIRQPSKRLCLRFIPTITISR